MKSQADIEALAALKLNEALSLLSAGFYDGAFYTGGYTIELLLKAKVCKTLGITDFFLFDKGNREVYRPFKVHDYLQLILLSGLFTEFRAELAANQFFQKYWALVIPWTEDARYLTGKTKTDAENFLISVNEVSIWIKKHL
jgi:hypothetical protein